MVRRCPLDRRAIPWLEKAQPKSLEGIDRVRSSLVELRSGPTLEELRAIRAIEVLEQIGTPDSIAPIRELQTGDPAAVLTREAKAAK